MLRRTPAPLLRTLPNAGRHTSYGIPRNMHELSDKNGTALYDYSVSKVHQPENTFVASVALVGAPNAGKSSLMNSMIGNRIAAVSRKVNTTRHRTVGAYTEGLRQLLFWDTPGVVERQFVKNLGAERRELTTAGWGAAADADVCIMVVDASRGLEYWKRCAKISEQLVSIRRTMRLGAPEMQKDGSRLAEADASPSAETQVYLKVGTEDEFQERTEGGISNGSDSRLLLVLNKCDITRPRTRLLEAVEFFRDNVEEFANNYDEKVYMVSAYNGKGVDDLRNVVLRRAKPGDFQVESGTSHCEDDLDLIREHIWEKLLHCIHQKVPYTCKFENDGMTELPNGDVHVSEIIRVPRGSVVPIVIGPKGRTIQWIRETAMVSASKALGRPVHLKLTVKAV